MSNGTYERFGKLLAALGKIVYDDKRHVESVCARLQSLVFDQYEWPNAKNWVEIRELARTNRAMAAIVALLDLSQKDQVSQQIIAAFPECFAEKEVSGPIPLSCIRAMALARGRSQTDESSDYIMAHPYWYDAVSELDIDVIIRKTDDSGQTKDPMLPEDIDPRLPQGAEVQIDRIWYVILENHWRNHYMVLTRLENVDTSC